MFSVYCKHCGATLLLGPANILAVQNTSAGIVVRFRCYRGHEGLWRNADDQSRRPLVRAGGHGTEGDLAGPPAATAVTSTSPARPARLSPANAQHGQRARNDRPDFSARGSSMRSGGEDLDSLSPGGNAWRPEWARWSRTPWRRPRRACAGTTPRRGRPRSGS